MEGGDDISDGSEADLSGSDSGQDSDSAEDADSGEESEEFEDQGSDSDDDEEMERQQAEAEVICKRFHRGGGRCASEFVSVIEWNGLCCMLHRLWGAVPCQNLCTVGVVAPRLFAPMEEGRVCGGGGEGGYLFRICASAKSGIGSHDTGVGPRTVARNGVHSPVAPCFA